MKGFYFVTDSALSRRGIYKDVEDALAAGVEYVQYRDKTADTKTLFEEALELRTLCKEITFLINDRVDIALAAGADGVHLGQDDMPLKAARKLLGKKRIIGITVHTLREAEEAQNLGADYIGVSPIFATSTKKDAGRPVGVELIRTIKKHTRIPIVALGGITLSNAGQVIRAGADAVCAISAVLNAADTKAEVKNFQRLFRDALKYHSKRK